MRMRGLRGLLFDKDGTLFDFHATWGTWAGGYLARRAAGDAALHERLAKALGYDIDAQRFLPGSLLIAGTPDEVAARLAPLLGRAAVAVADELNAEAALAPQVPAAPLGPLLARLRARGLALGVATNDAEAPARAHLEAAGITAGFDLIVGSDSGFGAKPAPGQCLAFARHAGLEAREVAMIGDSLHDLSAARAAGMVPVAVLTGTAPREVLAPHAAVVLPSIAALEDWIDSAA